MARPNAVFLDDLLRTNLIVEGGNPEAINNATGHLIRTTHSGAVPPLEFINTIFLRELELGTAADLTITAGLDHAITLHRAGYYDGTDQLLALGHKAIDATAQPDERLVLALKEIVLTVPETEIGSEKAEAAAKILFGMTVKYYGQIKQRPAPGDNFPELTKSSLLREIAEHFKDRNSTITERALLILHNVNIDDDHEYTTRTFPDSIATAVILAQRDVEMRASITPLSTTYRDQGVSITYPDIDRSVLEDIGGRIVGLWQPPTAAEVRPTRLHSKAYPTNQPA